MEALICAVSCIVFVVLDVIDVILCILYRFADRILEDDSSARCYCVLQRQNGRGDLSDTLYARNNRVRELLLTIGVLNKCDPEVRGGKGDFPSTSAWNCRWSDCACERCASWKRTPSDVEKLHVTVLPQGPDDGTCSGKANNNVLFLHGFLSSSSLWTETVYPFLSDSTKSYFRLFVVDLLGFGRSPKPWNSTYTVSDHIRMIERSVIQPYEVETCHIVAHSMGCVIALALAAKHPQTIKSLTLISPPYFPELSSDQPNKDVLKKLAPKRVWPLLSFGCSVMSWYEHVGRTVCLLVCKNHRLWETLFKLITPNRKYSFVMEDFTRHTHHSAWHNFHNVLCGGTAEIDTYLDAISTKGPAASASPTKVMLLHGKKDKLVPFQCSLDIKRRLGSAELILLENADHLSVILGRERELARELERVWHDSSCKSENVNSNRECI